MTKQGLLFKHMEIMEKLLNAINALADDATQEELEEIVTQLDEVEEQVDDVETDLHVEENSEMVNVETDPPIEEIVQEKTIKKGKNLIECLMPCSVFRRKEQEILDLEKYLEEELSSGIIIEGNKIILTDEYENISEKRDCIRKRIKHLEKIYENDEEVKQFSLIPQYVAKVMEKELKQNPSKEKIEEIMQQGFKVNVSYDYWCPNKHNGRIVGVKETKKATWILLEDNKRRKLDYSVDFYVRA